MSEFTFDEIEMEMEMPTPCEHCGLWFDLNDGYGSRKWHPGITICPNCYKNEKQEIETCIKEFRVLTMWQPWATLLIYKLKLLETRPKATSWTIEKGSYLIHAASKWSREQERICQTEPFRTALGITLGLKKFKDLPLGAIIGAVDVVECCNIHVENEIPWLESKFPKDMPLNSTERMFGDYSDGRSAWSSTNQRVLQTPIPYKNGQGYYQKFKGEKSQLIFV